MTEHEVMCTRALENVSFPPGSAQKRFVREMNLLGDRNPTRPLSARQSAWLTALVWKYRRQIRDKVLVFHCGVLTGAAKPDVAAQPAAPGKGAS